MRYLLIPIFAFVALQVHDGGTQTEVWTRQFGSGATDEARASAAGGNDVYVVGSAAAALPGETALGSADAFIRKYDSSGAVLWTRQFGSTAEDKAMSVAVTSGAVYLAGFTAGTLPGQPNFGGASDGWIRKYDDDGSELWTRQLGTVGEDVVRDVAVDAVGGVYVAGLTQDTFALEVGAGSYDAFVRKYDAAGSEVWTTQFGSAAADLGHGVALAPSGEVFVVGLTQGILPGESTAGGADAFLIELDSVGSVVDYIQFGTPQDDVAEDVTASISADALVIGRTQAALPGETALGGEDIFIRKYDAAGVETWTTQYGTSTSDFAEGVAFDAGGYLIVSGATLGALPGETANGNLDGFLSRVDPASGAVVFNHQYGTDESDIAHRAGTDSSGNIYATGNTNGTFPTQSNSGSFDAFLVKVAIDDLDADGLTGALDNCPNASNPGQQNNDRNFLICRARRSMT